MPIQGNNAGQSFTIFGTNRVTYQGTDPITGRIGLSSIGGSQIRQSNRPSSWDYRFRDTADLLRLNLNPNTSAEAKKAINKELRDRGEITRRNSGLALTGGLANGLGQREFTNNLVNRGSTNINNGQSTQLNTQRPRTSPQDIGSSQSRQQSSQNNGSRPGSNSSFNNNSRSSIGQENKLRLDGDKNNSGNQTGSSENSDKKAIGDARKQLEKQFGNNSQSKSKNSLSRYLQKKAKEDKEGGFVDLSKSKQSQKQKKKNDDFTNTKKGLNLSKNLGQTTNSGFGSGFKSFWGNFGNWSGFGKNTTNNKSNSSNTHGHNGGGGMVIQDPVLNPYVPPIKTTWMNTTNSLANFKGTVLYETQFVGSGGDVYIATIIYKFQRTIQPKTSIVYIEKIEPPKTAFIKTGITRGAFVGSRFWDCNNLGVVDTTWWWWYEEKLIPVVILKADDYRSSSRATIIGFELNGLDLGTPAGYGKATYSSFSKNNPLANTSNKNGRGKNPLQNNSNNQSQSSLGKNPMNPLPILNPNPLANNQNTLGSANNPLPLKIRDRGFQPLPFQDPPPLGNPLPGNATGTTTGNTGYPLPINPPPYPTNQTAAASQCQQQAACASNAGGTGSTNGSATRTCGWNLSGPVVMATQATHTLQLTTANTVLGVVTNTQLVNITTIVTAIQSSIVTIGTNVMTIVTTIGTSASVGTATLFGWLNAFSKSIAVDRILNAMSVALQIHNAMMLSRNLGESLGLLITNFLTMIGLKNEKDEALNFSTILGKSIENLIKSIVGEEAYKGAGLAWKKLSAIYSAITNIYELLLNNLAGISEGLEIVGNYTGKIGNALKKGGVILENAYQWMDENIQIKSGRLGAIQKITDGLDTAQNITDNLVEVTEIVQETTESVKQIQTEIKTIEDNVKKKEDEKLIKEDQGKAISKSPNLEKKDLYNPES